MADLTLGRRWEEWAPTKLEGNTALPKPFVFEVACGLTRLELRQFNDAVVKTIEEKVDAVTQAANKALKPLKSKDLVARRKALEAWQLKLEEDLAAAEVDALATALEPYVRPGREPLRLNGKPVTSLRGYLEMVSMSADREALHEPLSAVRAANELEGRQRLFFKRPSGGGSSTPGPSAEQAKSQGASR